MREEDTVDIHGVVYYRLVPRSTTHGVCPSLDSIECTKYSYYTRNKWGEVVSEL